MSRYTIDGWVGPVTQATNLVELIDPALDGKSHWDDVWQVKLIDNGWGFGHSLVGKITGVTLGKGKTGHLDTWITVVLVDDSDKRRLGYVTGDSVTVEVEEIEWLEQRS